MSVIRPFAAIRYGTASSTDVSSRIAPPYDVLEQADKDALLQRDPRNFVKIDLPFVPPKTAGPDSVYQDARRTMEAWLADGSFVRDSAPAIYVYHQRYEYAGASYLRKKFFARLGLEAFGAGSVFPHEKTFGGPKEDRLCLTKATRCNMSPIFGLFEDANNAVSSRLDASIQGQAPLLHGVLDGVESRIWAVTDARAIDDVARLMKPKGTYIADGHHRYGTALMYRDWLRQSESLSADHPANFVLCAFCAMEDPGALILPTHRVLPGLAIAAALLERDTELRVSQLSANSPEVVLAALPKLGAQAFAFYSAKDDGYYTVSPRRTELLAALEPDHKPAWHKLALAVLHAYVIDRLVAPQANGGAAPQIHYVKNLAAAVAEARESNGSAFLMQPNTMSELRDVCQSGDLMPQKSTFFYPKLASGLVVNPLT